MTNHHKHTIVCIDDDPIYEDLYRTILEPAGFRVISAADPAQGYDVVTRERPSLVTLDVMMPEKRGFHDGLGLLKAFRDNPITLEIPVIIISALNDESDIHQSVDSATIFLPKQEMTPKRLLEKIRLMLKK